MQSIKKSDFVKYFNKDFWKAFKENVIFYTNENLSQEFKNKIVNELWDDIQLRKYYPSVPRKVLCAEKNWGVPRIIPVFEIKDYCLYYFCIKKLEDRIAENRVPNTFWWWSLWWYLRKSEEIEIDENKLIFDEFEFEMMNYYNVSFSQYSFNPMWWSKAYGDFNSKLKATIELEAYDYCIEFDISNFYDCLNLNLLETSIREISDSKDRDVVALLFHFLGYWNRKNNFYNKATVWIPQDALWDCSRILANFYLQKYDKYIFEECWDEKKYFRYADDQFIFWNSKKDLEEILLKAWFFLNKIWLNINNKKVKIWQVKELLEYRSFKLFDLVSSQNISDENIEEFITEIVNLFSNNWTKNIKNKGISLLNKAILLNCEKIDISKKVYLKSLFLTDDYLVQSKTFQLQKIYDFLLESERKEFLHKLFLIAQKYKFNVFHYSFLQFLLKNNFSDKELREIIEELDSFYS